ncbi:MAG TPA: hypothetical protein VFZ35_06595 [Sphingomicrobium sp.]
MSAPTGNCDFPRLSQLSNLYWHQMGSELYGSAAGALEVFLSDASKLSDGGREYKRQVPDEVTRLSSTFDQVARNGPNGPFVAFGGSYFFKEDLEQLLAVALRHFSSRDA